MGRISIYKERWLDFKQVVKDHIKYINWLDTTDKKDPHGYYIEWCFYQEKAPSKWSYIQYRFALYAGIFKAFVCLFKGHKFADMGYANAESGVADIVCKRCGHDGGYHVLY